jgi:3-phytase
MMVKLFRWPAMGLGLAVLVAGCGTISTNPDLPLAATTPAPAQRIAAAVQTEPVAAGEPNSAVVVLDAVAPERSRIVSTAALGGLQIHALDGRRIGAAEAGEVASVDVAYDVPVAGTPSTVLAAVDTTDNRLRLYTMTGDALTERSARIIALGFAAEGVCLYRNRLDGALHAFVVGDGGEIDQLLIYATSSGQLDARQIRRIHVPSPLTQCVADPQGVLYAAEETVGIWRFNANPEADTSATLVDSPRTGRIAEEVGGLALYDGGAGARWLIAADSSAGRINVYDRGRDDAYVGSFAAAATDGKQAIGEPGPLFASSVVLGAAFPSGVLLVADEDGANYKLLSFADVAAALPLAVGTPQDPRRIDPAPVPVVQPVAETAPVISFGDAADDPAIWANPVDPARSLLVATDKKSGLYVYDLQGNPLHYRADGKMNNVDLREGFVLSGKPVVLVTASNRTHKSIAIYRLDPSTRQLVDVADGLQPTGLQDPYGLCMYRSKSSGKTYVFINSGDGPLRQWELVDAGNGKVKATLVRQLTFESQTEGCVADDDAGTLFIGEEDVALWRLAAEPDAPTTVTAVDRVADNPAIKDDLEGVGLYDLGGGRGYLVVSSQGNDTYAVYRREGRQEYLGSFAVVIDGERGIDGISETDGLDVSSRNLGQGFESGAMVAQDGRNLMPVENQNYKVVPWSAIAAALGLEQRKP